MTISHIYTKLLEHKEGDLISFLIIDAYFEGAVASLNFADEDQDCQLLPQAVPEVYKGNHYFLLQKCS